MGGLALPALGARGGGAVVFLVLGYLGDSLILGDCQGLGDRPEEKSPFWGVQYLVEFWSVC